MDLITIVYIGLGFLCVAYVLISILLFFTRCEPNHKYYVVSEQSMRNIEEADIRAGRERDSFLKLEWRWPMKWEDRK